MTRVLLMTTLVVAVICTHPGNDVHVSSSDRCDTDEDNKDIADSRTHYTENEQTIGDDITVTEHDTLETTACERETCDGAMDTDTTNTVEASVELDDEVSELFDKAADLHGRRMALTEQDLADADYLARKIEEEGREPPVPATVPSMYEYPRLQRVEPGQVGDVVELELEPGVFYKRITRAVSPPVFEIPGYLSDDECQQIREAALGAGLQESQLFGADMKDQYAENRASSELSRISDQAWLRQHDLGPELWTTLQRRVAALTELDIGVIQGSEPVQVVRYGPWGHYHAHIDSTDDQTQVVLPCCFQTRCGDKEETTLWTQCCRLCRYMTVMYFLDDVDVGGETAFPLADMTEELYKEKMHRVEDQLWYNLSYYCHNSSLVVPPRRGTAIMWYNHVIDEQTGFLGAADPRSHHGGCDVKKGTKWIANHWISAPPYGDRFRQSVWP